MFGMPDITPDAIRSITVPDRSLPLGKILAACGVTGEPTKLLALLNCVGKPRLKLAEWEKVLCSALEAYAGTNVCFTVCISRHNRRDESSRGLPIDLTVHLRDQGFSIRRFRGTGQSTLFTLGVGYHGEASPGPAASGLLEVQSCILDTLGIGYLEELNIRRSGSKKTPPTLVRSDKRDDEGYPVFKLTRGKNVLAYYTFYPERIVKPESPFAVKRPTAFRGCRRDRALAGH